MFTEIDKHSPVTYCRIDAIYVDNVAIQEAELAPPNLARLILFAIFFACVGCVLLFLLKFSWIAIAIGYFVGGLFGMSLAILFSTINR